MTRKASGDAPKLLSSGNPQIPKGEGNAPVQAYINAMPGWKSAIGRKFDALIEKTVPGAAKAVKWNTPFYGAEPGSWFLALYCYKEYIQITFFRGTDLDPVPPKASKQEGVRYYAIYEDDGFDEELLAGWIRQASRLPGEKL